MPVKVVSLSLDPFLQINSIHEDKTVKVNLTETLKPGQRFNTELLAEDEHGQTVGVSVTLYNKNNRKPELIINELRTEYSKPRAEFIEFKIVSAGNLGSLRVFIAGNNNPMVYEFLPVEVYEDEYIVLHLRTLEDSCVDEYGDSLDESGGTDSSPAARDFWVPGSAKLLRKTDAVYVMDQDDIVLTAVMLSENPDDWWARESLSQTAELFYNQGAWKSPAGNICSPADAISSLNIKTAITRSISRDETINNTNTASDWYVTANSGATPGLPNNPKRF
jgi:hypothetical protein